jgi:PAS domain-containing protein
MTISLKRAEEAVQLGEARFLQLANALPHPVWTSDDDGQLPYINQKWLEQGFGSQGHWYEQERLAVEDQRRSGNLWKTAVTEGIPFELEVRFHPSSNDADRWTWLCYPILSCRWRQSRLGRHLHRSDRPATARSGAANDRKTRSLQEE